jgi:hypothetical protein
MEISTVAPFLDYFGKVRSRTIRLVACIPRDKVEWSARSGRPPALWSDLRTGTGDRGWEGQVIHRLSTSGQTQDPAQVTLVTDFDNSFPF